jgi:hypothetical protein
VHVKALDRAKRQEKEVEGTQKEKIEMKFSLFTANQIMNVEI